MIDLRSNAPRRYFVDAGGRRVLIGLTYEETFEFERLDSQPVVEPTDGPVMRDDGVVCSAIGEQRWQELYNKHEDAWKLWMAQNPTAQSCGFSLY